MKILFSFVTKQATLKKRSTVQSLPFQLEFPDQVKRTRNTREVRYSKERQRERQKECVWARERERERNVRV